MKKENLPFRETLKNNIKTRIFNESIDDHELKWHYDQEDRIVKIVKSNGWKFQMDNEIPRNLIEGDILKIPKGKYHRVIKGYGDLIVKIKETEFKTKIYESVDKFDRYESLINDFLSNETFFRIDENFIGYRVIVGKGKYDVKPVVKVYGVFKKPFSMESSDKVHNKSNEIKKILKSVFPFLKDFNINGGSTTTEDNFYRYLESDKNSLRGNFNF